MKVPKNITYPFVQQTKFGKVKIYKCRTDDDPEYVVSWVSRELGRQRKFYRDQDKAFLKMEELVDDFEAGKISRKNITTEKAMQIAEYEDLLKPLDATIKDAVYFYVEHRKNDALKQVSCKEVVELYLEKFKNKETNLHYKNSKSVMTAFGNHFFKNIDKVVKEELVAYCETYKATRTKNNHLNHIKTLFRWAKIEGYLPKGDLVSDVIKPFEDDEDALPEKEVYEVIFTPEEMEKLLKAASNGLVVPLAIGAFGGVRTSEVEKLVWEEIDLEEKVIEIKKSKSKVKRRRTVIMTDNLIAWIKTYKGEMTGPLVPQTKNWLVKERALAIDATSVAWKHNGLRKGYISYRMADKDANSYLVAKQCGNSPAVVERDYKQLVKPSAARAWFGIYPEGYVPPTPPAPEKAEQKTA